LPLARCAEDFHLQVTQLTTTVSRAALARVAPCLAHQKKTRREAWFLLRPAMMPGESLSADDDQKKV
ncbi:hypothetical protein ACQ4WP_29010, partial [Janthinobacterium sp. GB4P2]|uniref:hypothetical protein n=1 Tax=Janthinobacterium sp. GB4P2 TaxID=3424189 RepID=UPI003F25916C